MKKQRSKMTVAFREAIELGEYDPKILSKYPEWEELRNHARFQKVREALDNKRHQLLTQYAEMNNMLNFRLKPELQDALEQIKTKLDKLEEDREVLYLKFSSMD